MVAQGPRRRIEKVGTKGGENSPQDTAETGDDLQRAHDVMGYVDLSIVEVEKGAPQLGSIVHNISTDSEKPHKDTPTKRSGKRRKGIDDMGTTTSSPAKKKLRDSTISQGCGRPANVKSVADVNSPPKARGRPQRGPKKP